MDDNIFIEPRHFFRDSPLRLVNIGITYITDMASFHRYLHRHTDLEIILFLTGRCEYTHNVRKYYVLPRSIAICNSGTFHSENYLDYNGSFIHIRISGLKLRNLPPGNLIPENISPVLNLGDSFNNFKYLAIMILNKSNSGSVYDKESLQLLMRTFLLQLYDKALSQCVFLSKNKSFFNWKPVFDVKLYLEKHYMEGIQISSASKKLNVDCSILSRSFRIQYGMTAAFYLDSLRVGEAQTLLTDTDLSITEICHIIGFNHSNTFYIAFKRLVGISPREYRQCYINNIIASERDLII